jgi:hypothetical protein|tara:strand:- start:2555 stop:3085 length:531 start_codon:yes stop_codon:yes gene_type:complete
MIINNKFQIDASQILFFARSIDDNNPLYVDVEYAKKKGYKNIIAPLTFIETHQQFDPNYKLRPNPDKQWPGTPRKKAEKISSNEKNVKKMSSRKGTGLHAEQHYEYHSLIYAGDIIRWEKGENKSWQREGKKGGKLIFTENIIHFYNQENVLVVTAKKVTVITEKVVENKASESNK